MFCLILQAISPDILTIYTCMIISSFKSHSKARILSIIIHFNARLSHVVRHLIVTLILDVVKNEMKMKFHFSQDDCRSFGVWYHLTE